MDLVQSAVLYGVMTLVSTYLVAFAYKNVKFVLKHKYVHHRNINTHLKRLPPLSAMFDGMLSLASICVQLLKVSCLSTTELPRSERMPSPRR